MQLDDEILKIGDGVYHLIHGQGTVKATNDNQATAVFGRLELIISKATIMQGKTKMFGVEKPLVFWRSKRHNRDVSEYSQIIEALDKL
jgi:hypothetical protein